MSLVYRKYIPHCAIFSKRWVPGRRNIQTVLFLLLYRSYNIHSVVVRHQTVWFFWRRGFAGNILKKWPKAQKISTLIWRNKRDLFVGLHTSFWWMVKTNFSFVQNETLVSQSLERAGSDGDSSLSVINHWSSSLRHVQSYDPFRCTVWSTNYSKRFSLFSVFSLETFNTFSCDHKK
jgi:hypothetical protein